MSEELWEALIALAEEWKAKCINPAHEYPSLPRVYGDGVEAGFSDAADELRAVLSAHPLLPPVPSGPARMGQ